MDFLFFVAVATKDQLTMGRENEDQFLSRKRIRLNIISGLPRDISVLELVRVGADKAGYDEVGRCNSDQAILEFWRCFCHSAL